MTVDEALQAGEASASDLARRMGARRVEDIYPALARLEAAGLAHVRTYTQPRGNTYRCTWVPGPDLQAESMGRA